MSEMDDGLGFPERDTPPVSADFGDVVRTGPYSADYEHVILAVHDGDWHDAIAIVDAENHCYSSPHTIPPGQILEVIGHKTYDEVIEIAARRFGDGELTERWIDFAKKHYPEPK